MARSEVLFSRWIRLTAAAPAATATADAAGTAAMPPATSGRRTNKPASTSANTPAPSTAISPASYGREEDAEEVTQEAFLRLHQALVARVVIESPRAWTLTVARRLMLDRLRHEHSASTRTVAVGAEVLEAVRDSAPTPEDTLAERRRRVALTHAVRGLTDLERQCLFARAEGLTLREIGEVVNMDLRRVAEVVARSVRTLQGRLRA